MILRDYQEQLCNELAIKLSQGKRKVLAQLATGGGKTISFAAICKRYTEKSGKSVLILVHRKELLQQTRRTLYNAYEIVAEQIIAGTKIVYNSPVYVGMVESVNRRIDGIKNIGLVIIDEAHIANFNKIHSKFEDAFFIGFTATPLSASKSNPLKNYYEDIVCGIDIPDLITAGNLCPNQTWSAKNSVDRSTLVMKGGEFDSNFMGIEFSKQKHVNNTVEIYKRKAEGTKAIIFNSSIQHSIAVTDAFTNAGYDCKHFDGETESAERTAVLTWFKNTPGAILCNVGIATTGFDEPTIETVIVNSSMASMPLWLQKTGRGSRPLPGKSYFTIIDMGGNAMTHGDWCDSRDWERIFFDPPKKGKDGVAPVKNCPECEAILPASTMMCKYCGYFFPPKDLGEELELGEFVLYTNNMNVLNIIEANKERKEYFSFFAIGNELAYQAKKTTKEMTDEKFTFILHKYFDLAKEWCAATSGEKRRNFNQWHKDLAKKTLIENLQKYFKKWTPSL